MPATCPDEIREALTGPCPTIRTPFTRDGDIDGVDGFLSTFITFKPEITWRYWNAVQANDMDTARAVIRDYDMPLFDYIAGVEGSFDAAIHGLLELYGIASRYRRPPYHSLTDAQMEDLAGFLKGKGLL